MTCEFHSGDIVHLNVGGTRFSTSRQTLTWLPDNFFTSMLSGRISNLKDETGAIFIDRDPSLFGKILGFLRSKEIDLNGVDLHILRHEAEFYGITPLVRRLTLCEDLSRSTCGGVLFHGIIPAPEAPPFRTISESSAEKRYSMNSIEGEITPLSPYSTEAGSSNAYARSLHSRLDTWASAKPVSVSDLRYGRTGGYMDHPMRVTIVKGHFNWLAVAFPHFVSLYRLKESIGWNITWVSPYIDAVIEHMALNAKVMTPGQDSCSRMLAVSYGSFIQLWQISDNGQCTREVGTFNLSASISSLFFIGCHLVALSSTGKFGVWHAMTQNWQIQDVGPITSYDTTGSFLLLGCDNGSIYNIDMQKFPLRMKDNDLLVTELYKDPTGDKITALSVYITPKANQQFVGFSGNWIEIAYGTSAGTVRIIVQHPETLGQGPQLFQTFTVHCSSVTKVMISEKHLVSVCSENNHVRAWSVTRFRGMISTQPGSMPLASFKIISIEDTSPPGYYLSGNDIGPFGEKDDQQVFVQKVVPDSDQLFVRLSSTGKRVCVIRSVDGTMVTAFATHECEGSSRMGSRPRRYLFTGHCNGKIQIWDLSTALELAAKGTSLDDAELGGPTADELIHLVDHCDLSNSRNTTPSASPSPALMTGSYGTTPSVPAAAAQCTPQTARRRFLEERSHVGPLGASGVMEMANGRAAAQGTGSSASVVGSTESLGGSASNTSPPVKFHS